VRPGVYGVMISAPGRIRGTDVSEVTVTEVADSAFTDFWAAHRGPVYRALSLTLGDPDLAGDAVDEAMARAFERWSVVRTYENPAGWVYRVGMNWATSVLRRRRRRPRWTSTDAVVEPMLADPTVAAAVAALPEGQRAAIVLRFFLDWKVEDVAAALGVPPGTVKSRLHRALGALRLAIGAER
jgi:RNA polymerase sigma factor (sigma-70 family)